MRDAEAPVRSIAAAEDVCRAAGLSAVGEYGPWLSPDGRVGVGIARLGSMYLGAGVSLVLDRAAEQEQQIAKIEPGAPASLLRAAIECAWRMSGHVDALPEIPNEELSGSRYPAPDQLAHQGPRGVTLTHLPTGMTASCHSERSGLQNTVLAYRELCIVVARAKEENIS